MKTTHVLPGRWPTLRPRPVLAAAMTVSLAVMATGCGNNGPERPASVSAVSDNYSGTVVEPPLSIAPVTLRDTDGNAVRLDRIPTAPESVTAVFFGFTHCDDVCPTTMADLAAARRALPSDLSRRTQLVFVTVDPERDTASVLRTWLDRFDPSITGLRGPVRLVHRAEDSLFASRSGRSTMALGGPSADADGEHVHEGTNAGGVDYEVDHTSIVYLFGPEGESIIYTGGATAIAYTADFKRLLQ